VFGGDGACTSSPPPSRTGPALAVLSVAQFTATLEFAIVFVALPSIDRGLQMGTVLAQWVSSAYAVVLASWLIVAGRLADRFGAARLFVHAMALFSLTSAIAAAAPTAEVLLVARAGQGLAAALLQPAALGLLQARFSAPGDRRRAFGVWSAAGALGLALGALIGGLLTAISWRLTFAINIPLTLACAIGALAWLRDIHHARHDQQIPLLAAGLATCTVLALTSGLTFAAGSGWSSPHTLLALALAVILAGGLLRHERGAHDVLVDRELRRSPSLRLGALATAIYMASMGSTYYLLTVVFQLVAARGPIATGLAFLPLTISVALGGPLAQQAMQRRSEVHVLAAGFALGALGLLGLSLTTTSPLAATAPALVLAGLGNGLVFTTMFVIGTRNTPPHSQSSAGALLTTTQYISSAVALACLVLVLGPSPTTTSSATALALTAALAAAGAGLAVIGQRIDPTDHARPGASSEDDNRGHTT
jgi:MFS family permease